ncbi:DEKNAAC101573 [Brettanomyces naardenensis]|uniref:DEKNAAC101573 n=1 Tax=Brettanomyces naardenensis TaxID=13370 RepID=A0A448YIQ6_BRENA|nr:DEKNAAC101573 [Brettanomyces naardenensis]
MNKLKQFLKSQVVPPTRPIQLSLLDFNNLTTFSKIQTTSDSVLGGYSTAYVEPYRLKNGNLVARFHGNLNQTVPANNPKVKKSGWAMFKTKNRNPKQNAQFKPFYWFQKQANFWWDFTSYQAIHLRVANLTPSRKFMLNVQTDTMSRTDLFQHRLFTSGVEPEASVSVAAEFNDTAPAKIKWEDLFIDIDDLVLTNRGVVQIQYYGEFERDRIKSVGLSISDGIFGPYDLLVDKIECIGGDAYMKLMVESRHSEERERLEEIDVKKLSDDDTWKV